MIDTRGTPYCNRAVAPIPQASSMFLSGNIARGLRLQPTVNVVLRTDNTGLLYLGQETMPRWAALFRRPSRKARASCVSPISRLGAQRRLPSLPPSLRRPQERRQLSLSTHCSRLTRRQATSRASRSPTATRRFLPQRPASLARSSPALRSSRVSATPSAFLS